jgi:hypothetical protein
MEKRLVSILRVTWCGVALSGCGDRASVGDPAADPGGSGGAVVLLLDARPAAGGEGGSGGGAPPTDDANCGAVVSDMSQLPADVLLVLDRSESMSWDMRRDDKVCVAGDPGCQQRWATVTATLDQVVAASSVKIRWGLKLFSTPVPLDAGAAENCLVAPGLEVAVGEQSAAPIREVMRAIEPLGYTPTLQGLKQASAYLQGLADANPRYILLATDGEPNCDGASPTTSGAVQANHVVDEITTAAAAGIRVFVIGMGPATNLRNLDKFAVAGKTENYYPATSAAELGAALAAIVGQVASCTFALPSPPPDANNLAVYLDKQRVPQDATNGWILGADQRSVLFVGSTCDGIKAERYREVQVYFGCPGTTPPSVIP